MCGRRSHAQLRYACRSVSKLPNRRTGGKSKRAVLNHAMRHAVFRPSACTPYQYIVKLACVVAMGRPHSL